jgi:hypothetical protein
LLRLRDSQVTGEKHMSIEIARKILDQVKDGSNEYSTFVITEALKATGDYTEIYE